MPPRLGMRDSHFANPHGLPDERNQTTARDMAILARALIREFPDHQDLFHIGAIQFGRRIMRNTNGLIGRYPGADGMKTGFICSAGFNVVASATRNGRHLITVVMGAPSANERTMKAAELFDRGFSCRRTAPSPCARRPAGIGLDHASGHALGDLRPSRPDAPRGRQRHHRWRRMTAAASRTCFHPTCMAFAGGRQQPLRTSLGPRSAVQPERVWVGLNPPSESRDRRGGRRGSRAAARHAREEAKSAKVAKSKNAKGKSRRQGLRNADKREDRKVEGQGQGSRHDQRQAGDRQGQRTRRPSRPPDAEGACHEAEARRSAEPTPPREAETPQQSRSPHNRCASQDQAGCQLTAGPVAESTASGRLQFDTEAGERSSLTVIVPMSASIPLHGLVPRPRLRQPLRPEHRLCARRLLGRRAADRPSWSTGCC